MLSLITKIPDGIKKSPSRTYKSYPRNCHHKNNPTERFICMLLYPSYLEKQDLDHYFLLTMVMMKHLAFPGRTDFRKGLPDFIASDIVFFFFLLMPLPLFSGNRTV